MQDLVFGSGASSDAAAILEPPRLRRGGNQPGGSVGAASHPRVKCPRCDSFDTKFCYYNNYNLSQPRHFCKSCRRYWTRGGALRNVPVGGASRKPKRSSSSSGLSKPPRPKSRKIDVDVEGYDDNDRRSEGSTLAAPATPDAPILSASAAGNLAEGFDCGAPLLGGDLPSFCLGTRDCQMPLIDHPAVLDPPQLWPGASLFDGTHMDHQVGGALWGENQWVDEGDSYLFLP